MQQSLFVCASVVVNGYAGDADPMFVVPDTRDLFLGGATTFTRIPRSGIVAALDVTTNRLKWRYRWPDQCYSGLLATGGGLLFVGRSDGRLTALDSTSGKQLWEFQTGAGMHAPVSTFEHKGKQYVIAFSAGSSLMGSARGDSVWLFGLDGKMGPVQPGASVSRTAADAPGPAVGPAVSAGVSRPANLVEGKRIFAQACAVCHGEDGKGGHTGGAPLDGMSDLETAVRTVTDGRRDMPPFRSAFTADQIRDVAAYVVETLAARRP